MLRQTCNPGRSLAKKTVKDYIRTIVGFPHEGIMFRDLTALKKLDAALDAVAGRVLGR